MLPTDVRALSPAKLAALAEQLGIEPRGTRGILVMRKSLTDPRTHAERVLKRSTKTTDLRLAVLRATQWWEDHVALVHGGKFATLNPSAEWASLKTLRDHYLAAGTCSPHVRKQNFGRLTAIVRELYPEAADPLALSCDVLDGRAARVWLLQRKTAAETQFLPDDHAGCERAKRGANSCFRMARSVFSSAMLRSYADAGLRLPDTLKEFVHAGFLPAAKAPPSQQLTPETVKKVWATLPALRTVQPGVWAAFLLMFRGGLRNSEAAAARWDWLSESIDGSWRLALHVQASYKPKAEPRSVAIDAGIVKLLASVRRTPEDPFLVPAETVPQRAHLCGRALNEFLRGCGVQTVKNKIAYRLRGHAITEIILAHGMKAAQGFAGHTSDRTTEIYRGAEVPYTALAMPQ